jgi:Cytochrome c7 and related cytochrome c
MRANRYAIVLFLLVGLTHMGRVKATDNPHEISSHNKNADCTSCHLEQPQAADPELLNSKNHQADAATFKTDGIEMCTGCHDKDDGHKVGIKLDFDVPADLPLGAKNKLTCLTCHYTHGGLTSSRPQASFSFIDRVLDAELMHKSYLLRRNNTDGELCLTCHEVKEGSR